MEHQTLSFDSGGFRRALGMFATGVTIVTARGEDGTPVGMTANSFNSVSLDPPMVLWSLAKSARSLPVFHAAQHWNVHILANEQNDLANRFARSGEDKFAGLALERALSEAPLLADCSARFQCRTVFRYEGGDHIIFVGEVIGFDRSEKAPLLYVSGEYALATRLCAPVATAATDGEARDTPAPFTEDLLGYLLGRAHYQFMWGLRRTLDEIGISDGEFFVLSLLAVRAPLGADEIAAHTNYTGVETGSALLADMCARGLLEAVAGPVVRYALRAEGHAAAMRVLAAAYAVEAALVEQLGGREAAGLRNLLKHLIRASDPGLPTLWHASA